MVKRRLQKEDEKQMTDNKSSPKGKNGILIPCTCNPKATVSICGGVVRYKCRRCGKTVERNPHFAEHHNYECGCYP